MITKITRRQLRQIINESLKQKWNQRISQETKAWHSELSQYVSMLNQGHYEDVANLLSDYPEILYQIVIMNLKGEINISPYYDHFLKSINQYPALENALKQAHDDYSDEAQKIEEKFYHVINNIIQRYYPTQSYVLYVTYSGDNMYVDIELSTRGMHGIPFYVEYGDDSGNFDERILHAMEKIYTEIQTIPGVVESYIVDDFGEEYLGAENYITNQPHYNPEGADYRGGFGLGCVIKWSDYTEQTQAKNEINQKDRQ